MLEPHYYKELIEAGCDEAGRGCLAGSVYAAAVILPVKAAEVLRPSLTCFQRISTLWPPPCPD